MAVFSFDLEDGNPPISFTLKPQDAERFISFMSHLSECKKALTFLIEVKEHKEKHGKDEWYTVSQSVAWEQAIIAVADITHPPDITINKQKEK